MATLVDVVELMRDIGFHDVVFPFILVLALVYGVLERYKPFGDNKGINAVVGVVIGLLFISATRTLKFVSTLLPAVTALIVVVLLLLLIFTFIGVPQETIAGAFKTPAGAGIVLVLFLILIFAAIGATFSGTLTAIYGEDGETTTTEPGAEEETPLFGNTIKTLFHPTILGLIIMVLIFSVTTYFLTRGPVKR